jgi:prepilin-type N-terminal cleavage/methylation domain-containing protein
MKLVGFSIIELMISIAIVAIMASLSVPIYLHYMQNVYTKATIKSMLTDAQFLDNWKNQYGSFIDNFTANKTQWPKLPINNYAHSGKILYSIYLSPVNNPLPNSYHIIAYPIKNSGLEGTGCICLDSYHNVYTGMSKECNNSHNKC